MPLFFTTPPLAIAAASGTDVKNSFPFPRLFCRQTQVSISLQTRAPSVALFILEVPQERRYSLVRCAMSSQAPPLWTKKKSDL